jgi:hypothetical protein
MEGESQIVPSHQRGGNKSSRMLEPDGFMRWQVSRPNDLSVLDEAHPIANNSYPIFLYMKQNKFFQVGG